MSDDDITRLPDTTPADDLLAEGQIFGVYRVIRQLGAGGMGQVYEVVHQSLNTRYALKLIDPALADRRNVHERFEREARVMAKLKHPNILRVDHFGETDGRFWLRMELVEGWMVNGVRCVSLAELLRGAGQLDEGFVWRTLDQLLDGLAHAHAEGFVHRDLKPANLLFDAEGTLKIADFGLVRLVGAGEGAVATTRGAAPSTESGDATRLDGAPSSANRSSGILGTYAFMSPEQKRGLPVDHRSDLYSAGLIGFQMLTGELGLNLERPSELAPEIDPSWDTWFERALETRPELRFNDAAAMRSDLPGNAADHGSSLGGMVGAVLGGMSAGSWRNLVKVVLAGALLFGVFLLTKNDGLRQSFEPPEIKAIRRESMDQTVRHNLDVLHSLVCQYCMDKGVAQVDSMSSLVSSNYIKEITPIGGENYNSLFPIACGDVLNIYVPELAETISYQR